MAYGQYDLGPHFNKPQPGIKNAVSGQETQIRHVQPQHLSPDNKPTRGIAPPTSNVPVARLGSPPASHIKKPSAGK